MWKPISEMSAIEMIDELEKQRKYMEHVPLMLMQNHIMRNALMSIGFVIQFQPELPEWLLLDGNNEGDENDSNPNL